MRKGKSVPDESDFLEEGPQESPPLQEDYAIAPGARRPLSRRDRDHNQQVERLFGGITPGLPIDSDCRELQYDPQPFSHHCIDLFKRLKIEFDPLFDDLKENWEALVGPQLAREARPGKLVDNILYLYVGSSTRLFELRRSELPGIEAAVKAFPGGQRIRQVRLLNG